MNDHVLLFRVYGLTYSRGALFDSLLRILYLEKVAVRRENSDGSIVARHFG